MTAADQLIATTPVTDRVNLLGLTRHQLEIFFTDLGEKRFRAQQVMKWIHHRGVRDFEEMTDLSQSLRRS
jgi:23S rRNA (adenine2503-C2)-methyltransferase